MHRLSLRRLIALTLIMLFVFMSVGLADGATTASPTAAVGDIAAGTEEVDGNPTATAESTAEPAKARFALGTPEQGVESAVETVGENVDADIVEEIQFPTMKPTAEPTPMPTRVPTPEPTEVPTPAPTIEPITLDVKGDNVKLVQEKLREYGFMTGSADGYFGPVSQKGVMAFQEFVAEYIGIELHYVAPTEAPVIETVEGTEAENETDTAEAEPTIKPFDLTTIHTSRLPLPEATSSGYSSYPSIMVVHAASGGAGRYSRVGEPTEETADIPIEDTTADDAEGEPVAEKPETTELPTVEVTEQPTQAPTPAPTEVPTPVPTAEPTPEPTPYVADGILDQYAFDLLTGGDFDVYYGDLEKGDRSTDVKRLQTRLSGLYYLNDTVDGIYGGNTKSAVENFQKYNNLQQTGIADQDTQEKLYSADAIATTKPTPAPSSGNGNGKDYSSYKLVVDVSDQKVYVYGYENGSYSALSRVFTCSTGKKDTPTPLGTFYGDGPVDKWHYFEKYKCWAQYAWRIDGSILFHSVIFNSKDPDSVSKSSVNALGSRASHGCVRLSVANAKWIYNNCKAGTIVVVRN